MNAVRARSGTRTHTSSDFKSLSSTIGPPWRISVASGESNTPVANGSVVPGPGVNPNNAVPALVTAYLVAIQISRYPLLPPAQHTLGTTTIAVLFPIFASDSGDQSGFVGSDAATRPLREQWGLEPLETLAGMPLVSVLAFATAKHGLCNH